ncbi:MAG: permease prefix domain 1-containing protein, partial [bacterium]
MGRDIRPGVWRLFRLPSRTADHARADADAELDTFLDERIDHLVRRGMTPDAAREQALARLGSSLEDARVTLRQSAE